LRTRAPKKQRGDGGLGRGEALEEQVREQRGGEEAAAEPVEGEQGREPGDDGAAGGGEGRAGGSVVLDRRAEDEVQADHGEGRGGAAEDDGAAAQPRTMARWAPTAASSVWTLRS
jgi:hypothetical protein